MKGNAALSLPSKNASTKSQSRRIEQVSLVCPRCCEKYFVFRSQETTVAFVSHTNLFSRSVQHTAGQRDKKKKKKERNPCASVLLATAQQRKVALLPVDSYPSLRVVKLLQVETAARSPTCLKKRRVFQKTRRTSDTKSSRR